MGDRYRVRWANVQYPIHGRYLQWKRMCIAERKTRWFGWWPVTDAAWHFEEQCALSDIEADKELRKPFPPNRYVK